MLERSSIRFQFWHLVVGIVLVTSILVAGLSGVDRLGQTPPAAPPALTSEANAGPLTGPAPAAPGSINEVDSGPLTGRGPGQNGSSPQP